MKKDPERDASYDVPKAEVRIPVERVQINLATLELKKNIEKGLISKSGFTYEKLLQIKKGDPKINGYTWLKIK